MTELSQQAPRRPGVAVLGFVIPFTLLTSVVIAYTGQLFLDAGWRGGEYARAFIGVAMGSIMLGSVLRLLFSQPWKSLGTGMLAAGILGMVTTVVVVVLLLIAFAQGDWLP